MTAPTIDNVAPLVAQKRLQRDRLLVVFRCPRSGQVVESEAVLGGPAAENAADAALSEARMGLFGELRRGAMRSLRQAVGGGAAGRIVGASTKAALQQHDRSQAAALEQAALVAAFESVREGFEWDPAVGWVLADGPGG